MSQFHLPLWYHLPIIIFSQVCFAVHFLDVTNHYSKLFEFRKTYECTNSYVTKSCMYSYTILFYFRTFRPFTLSCSHGSPQICPNLVCPYPHRKNSVVLQILIFAFHNKHHSSTFIFNCIANTIPLIIPVSPQFRQPPLGQSSCKHTFFQ